jgi:hypothetical protein
MWREQQFMSSVPVTISIERGWPQDVGRVLGRVVPKGQLETRPINGSLFKRRGWDALNHARMPRP